MNGLRGYGPALAWALLLHVAALAFLLLGLKSHEHLASPSVHEVVVQLLPPPQLVQPVPIVPPKPRPLPLALKPVAKPVAKPVPAPKEAPVLATHAPVAPTPEAPAPVTQPKPAPPAPPPPISAPRFDAAYLDNPKPVYPLMARRNGDQGKVLLRVHVTAEGRADEVQVQTTSGVASLDKAALASVQTWRFLPARQGTQPVPAWVLVPVVFKLEE
jgi:protein TonB